MPDRKPTLLCVDDDEQCLAVRRILFEAHGFNVITTTSPRQGLRLHQLKRFDAAVIDFQMPEMNGGVLAAKMKGARSDVPVVILSGLPYAPEGTPRCYDRFICKADSGFKLVKEIQELISASPTGGGPAVALPFRQRVITMAGVAVGVAVQGFADLRTRTRVREPHGFGVKAMAASGA